MGKLLISPLGMAPGVVTAAYYFLHENGFGVMDEIITVTTMNHLSKLCEREIEAELLRSRDEIGTITKYSKATIPSNEIYDSTDLYRFRKIILQLLQSNLTSGHSVYVNLTGGRKSMVAAAAMAAQVCKPTKIFSILVDEDLEQNGNITSLLKLPLNRRRQYLRPLPNRVSFVEIPLLSLGERGIIAPTTWLARIFEFTVGAYLSTVLEPAYSRIEYQFFPDYLNCEGLGELDILASRELDGTRELLLCECKMREEPVQTEWLERLERKKQKIIEELKPSHPERVKSWLVTIAGRVEEPDVARKYGIDVYQAKLPQNWRTRADWEVESLIPLVMCSL